MNALFLACYHDISSLSVYHHSAESMCYADGTQVRPTSRAVFHVRGSKLGSNEVHQMAR